jgi:hypothetical protein
MQAWIQISNTQAFSVSVFICVHLWLKIPIAFLRFDFEPRIHTKGREFEPEGRLSYSCLFVFIRGLNFDPSILLTTDEHGWTRIRSGRARFNYSGIFCICVHLCPSVVKNSDRVPTFSF